MKNYGITDLIASILGMVSLTISVQDVESIVNIVCAVVGALIVVITGVLRIIGWAKKSLADKKLTQDEIEEGIQILTDTKEELDQHIKDKGSDNK